MESIDALAKAIQEFEGGLILVSHDMRLISQVANEIWICDDKTITKHKGDIQSFKMDMRAQMGIEGEQVGKLRGDASTKKKEGEEKPKPKPKPKPKAPEVIAPKVKPVSPKPASPPPAAAPAPAATNASGEAPKRYIPPHLRRKMAEQGN
jgi:ATP-binding cassette subfamily F protein 2